jgi:hypothetical protein
VVLLLYIHIFLDIDGKSMYLIQEKAIVFDGALFLVNNLLLASGESRTHTWPSSRKLV